MQSLIRRAMGDTSPPNAGERRKSSLQSIKKLSLFSHKGSGAGIPETIQETKIKSEVLCVIAGLLMTLVHAVAISQPLCAGS